jgi:hypothetical protein
MPMSAEVRAATANIVGALRRAALTYGCTKMRLFSQAYGPVQESIDRQGSGGGVCRELSVQWLASQKNGTDFLGKLIGLGGAVNELAMGQVVKDFQAMGELNRIEQREYTERQLRTVGLAPSTAEVKNEGELGIQSVSSWFCAHTGTGSLRFLGIRGGVDHAVAINLTSGKESFFDPNLGEFQFTGKRLQMQAFLHAQIFPTSDSGLGIYIGRPNKVFRQIERICCM